MSSEEKKSETIEKSTMKEKSDENEDSGLAQFKEETFQKFIIEKALTRPEANCCTYNKGYITQECFVCMTCFQETKKRSIICLGCSIKCHEDNHDIAPIGFKRHMRCDCGNSKFLIECKLKKKEEVDYENEENVYNHNMENKYCFCDEEDDGNSTMAQCFFCEDWFHKEHLNIYGMNNELNKNNENNENEEDELPNLDLTCKNCVIKLKDILSGYNLKKIVFGLIPKEPKETVGQNKIIELKDDNNDNIEENNDKTLLGKKRNPPDDLNNELKEEKKDEIKEKKDENNLDKNKDNNNNEKCKLNISQESSEFLSNVIKNEQNLFIDCEIFLKNICHCKSCSKKYIELGYAFLNKKNEFQEWAERKTFDDIINDDKFIEEAKNDSQFSLENVEKSVIDFFKSKEYRQLTVEQQLLIKGYIGELSNKLGEYVSTLNHTVITVEDIYNFINKYKDYFEKLKQE